MASGIKVLLGVVLGLMACQSDDDLEIMYNLEGEYSTWFTDEFMKDHIAISNLKELDEHTHQTRHSEYSEVNGMGPSEDHYESRVHSMFNGIYPVEFGAYLSRNKEYTELSVLASYKTYNKNPWSSEILSFNLTNETYERTGIDQDTFHINPSPFDSIYQVLENHVIAGKTYAQLIRVRFEEIENYGTSLSAPIVYIEPEWGIVAYELNDGRIWTVQK